MLRLEYLISLAANRVEWSCPGNYRTEQMLQRLEYQKVIKGHAGIYCLRDYDNVDGHEVRQYFPCLPQASKVDAFNNPVAYHVQLGDSTTIESFEGSELFVLEDEYHRTDCQSLLGYILAIYADLGTNNRIKRQRRQKLVSPWLATSRMDDFEKLRDILKGISDDLVFASDDLETHQLLNVLTFDIQPHLDTLDDDAQRTYQNFLKSLGYQSISRDKKERLLNNETMLDLDTMDACTSVLRKNREALRRWLLPDCPDLAVRFNVDNVESALGGGIVSRETIGIEGKDDGSS